MKSTFAKITPSGALTLATVAAGEGTTLEQLANDYMASLLRGYAAMARPAANPRPTQPAARPDAPVLPAPQPAASTWDPSKCVLQGDDEPIGC